MPRRPISDEARGMHVLVDNDAANIDIVAVHGRGAHPDDTWTQLREAESNRDDPNSYVNWLQDSTMLPAVLPGARVMRYGYSSDWFGSERVRTSPYDISRGLLRELHRKRQQSNCHGRPIIFVAHSFGGVVLLQAFLSASKHALEIYNSIVGLVFYGTPFRGNDHDTHTTLVTLAEASLAQEEVFPDQLRTSREGDEYLKTLVENFHDLMRTDGKPNIACIYERRPTNIARVVPQAERSGATQPGTTTADVTTQAEEDSQEQQSTEYRFWVDEKAGTLDTNDDRIRKYSRPCTHFDLHKYRTANTEDFRDLTDIMQWMYSERQAIMTERDKKTDHRKDKEDATVDFVVDFDLQGIPWISHDVPRTTEMSRLLRHFASSAGQRQRTIFSIHGMAGLGKTQLCCEFCRETKDRFSAIFWLDGSSKSALIRSMADAMMRVLRAQRLDVDQSAKEKEDVERLKEEFIKWLMLKDNKSWLLVFNNVDREWDGRNPDADSFSPIAMLPTADHGSVLISTRLSRLARLSSDSLHLQPMDEPLSQRLFEKLAGEQTEDLTPLMKKLGGLPLALVQAGTFIKETKSPIAHYLRCYDETWSELMDEQSIFSITQEESRSILTTFSISYQQVNRQAPQAAELADLFAFFDHRNISHDLVVPSSTSTDQASHLGSHLWSPREARLAVGVLYRYSLLLDGKDLSVHPVIHRWLWHNMDDTRKRRLLAQAIKLLGAQVESTSGDPLSASRLVPHVRALASRLELSDLRHTTPTVYSLGAFLDYWLLCKEVGHWYANAMLRDTICHGPHHENTLTAMGSLGSFYRRDRQVRLAFQLLLQAYTAMKGRLNRLAEPSQSVRELTYSLAHGLAHVYFDLENLTRAEQLYNEARDGRTALLGPHHPLTLDTETCLGRTYGATGRYSDAIALLQTVLRRREQHSGNHVQDILKTVNELGNVYFANDDFSNAQLYLERAYIGFVPLLGPAHIITVNAGSLLALVFARQGAHHQSSDLFTQLQDAITNETDEYDQRLKMLEARWGESMN